MGDRTYAYYKVHPEDIARLLELAPELRNIDPAADYEGWDPSGPYADDGLRHIDECNYGGGQDWYKLAAAGIRFYGWSGAGGDYGEIDFHCDGSELRTAVAGYDGGYVVQMVDGDFIPEALDRLREYEASRLATLAVIDEAWGLLPCNMREAKQC